MPEPPAVRTQGTLAFLCWRGSDGVRTTSAPLPREIAEALASAYAKMPPRQDCWVEPVPWCDPPARKARRAD